jgi:hypothetical protein
MTLKQKARPTEVTVTRNITNSATFCFLPSGEKSPVPIAREVGWALIQVWTGTKNLAPTRIRSPDRVACSV